MTEEQFRTLAGLLLEIRDLLVLSTLPPPEEDGCVHPEENRVSLATLAKPDHWICNLCRYEHGVMQTQ